MAEFSSSRTVDVVIAGGGMVGASMALLLAKAIPSIQVLVADSFALPDANMEAVYRPSFDARSTALSYGSRNILQTMGVWSDLQRHLAAIERIHVSDRGRFGSVELTAAEVSWDALGYVVENQWLGKVLLSALTQQPNVKLCCPASVSAIAPLTTGVSVEVVQKGADHSKIIHAQLVVVADGADSGLRQALGMDVEVRNYQQTALIANVSFVHGRSNATAFERFTDWGPMALLPLPRLNAGEHRSALVWTMPFTEADALMANTEQQRLDVLQQRFGDRVGEFLQMGECATYPLRLVKAKEQVRSGIVVLGNAAHTLHPVAGQGFNLALRDCARLIEYLQQAVNDGRPLGSLAMLLAYQQQQQLDQQLTIAFSDQLPRLFTAEQWSLSLLRGLGLAFLDSVPAVKSQLIARAAGMQMGAAGAI